MPRLGCSLSRVAAVALLLAAGCEPSSQERPIGAVVDTLQSGAVRVRNLGPGAWGQEPELRWRVELEFRVGRIDGTGPDVFGRIGSVAVDVLGHIWVADTRAHEVRVFDERGQFLRTVGGVGQGPGEFGNLGVVHLGPDGHIWAEDIAGRRWEVFDTAGVRIAGYPSFTNLGGTERRWISESRLLEMSMVPPRGPFASAMESVRAAMRSERAYLVRHLTSEGSLVELDAVPAPVLPSRREVEFQRPGGEGFTIRAVPLAHNPSYALGHFGEFWVSDGGGAYEFRQMSFSGDTLLVVERQYEPVPVPDEGIRAARKALEPPEGMRLVGDGAVEVPTTFPPFTALHPSLDGTVWVRRDLEGGRVGLEVFDANGFLLGEVLTEVDWNALSIRLITADRILAVDTDDLGVQYVVSLRIVRPGDERL